MIQFKKTRLAVLLCFSTAIISESYAQDSLAQKSALTISGYAETYYTQDFNRPLKNTRPGFIYSHNRANEINVNLAFIKASYNTDKVRANFAIATGTYMNANYAAEQGVLKNMYEANVGVKISKKHNLWLDAGLLPSHIGFESAIGKDNWTLTRSLAAENSPYFETGLKLSYGSKNEKWYLAALYLNGWQRIQRVDGNTTPAFGTQVSYKPSPKVTLNYSGFAGSDQADSLRKMRYFHNLYGIFQVNEKFGIIAGIDFGMQQKQKNSSKFNNWYAPVLIVRYSPSAKINIAARAEYYQDENGVIISTGTVNEFKTFGISANIDYKISPHVVWRTEVRNFNSKDRIFTKQNGSVVDDNTSITTALAISF